MTLSAKHLAWFEDRAISGETALRLEIFSGRHARDGSVVPDPRGDILVFPFVHGGKKVGEKYRGPQKKFWQKKGNYKTFFNADVLNYPELEMEHEDGTAMYPLVITEGEPDTAAFVEAGYDFVVSVPDGAPQESDKPVPQTADDVDPEHDAKYGYVFNNWERLKKVKRIILATDGNGDGPGWRLAEELARRLGRSRCDYVEYPAEPIVPTEDGSLRPCKDANEVLKYFGAEAVLGLMQRAKPIPVKGLYKMSDFPDQGPIKTVSTGFKALDPDPDNPKKPHMLIYPGAFIPVSGIPGGGKTAVVVQIQFNLALNYGWRAAIASFETRPKPVLQRMLRSYHIAHQRKNWANAGLKQAPWTAKEIALADAFIDEYFSIIALTPDDEDSEADVDWVIDRLHDALIRYGIRTCSVDPWNEVDHKRRPGESVGDYTNRAIRSLKRFAYTRDVTTFVVCHPDKSAGRKAGEGNSLSLYDIADGATWVNKAEIGLMVRRLDPTGSYTEVDVKKVKIRGTGRVGRVVLNYLENLEMFDPLLPDQSHNVDAVRF